MLADLKNGFRSLREIKAWIQHSDFILALLVVGVVVMMVIPLPTGLLDVLITTNISLAVILLLVCIHISDAMRIASLPSIVLLTTLFRLGLNVTSTRLILSQADAGEVIKSFGSFVIADNLIVGAVIFIILTLIQYVVIAKGSERVAEVAARFALDAMPGKQLAIDADFRSGLLTLEQARQRRIDLQRESQLYGSMDGAMKFVKGDAVAAMVITAINLLGGLVIGIVQRAMTLAEAVQIYSLLTVGDGLVSQIPALLISTAAGIVVTRVAAEDEGAHLGREISTQVLAQPKALAGGAALLFLFAIVPGLPALPFLLLGLITGLIAAKVLQLNRHAGLTPQVKASLDEFGHESFELSPITLELSQALGPILMPQSKESAFIREVLPTVRRWTYDDLGLSLPPICIEFNDQLPDFNYRISLSKIPIAQGTVQSSGFIVLGTKAKLDEMGIEEARQVNLPGAPQAICSVPHYRQRDLHQQNVEIVDPALQIAWHLRQVAAAHADEFLGIQETKRLLEQLEQSHPAIVQEIIPSKVSLPQLAEVLRCLLKERISIRNLPLIMEGLAKWPDLSTDPGSLADKVRQTLKRYITFRFASADQKLAALLLDPMIEQAVRDAIQPVSQGRCYLALEPELCHDIVLAVKRHLEKAAPSEKQPVILTASDIRRFVREVLAVSFQELPVLSFDELLPSVEVQSLARVSV